MLKKYHVFIGTVNYKIQLDANNRILDLQVNYGLPQSRNSLIKNKLNCDTFKVALKFMLLLEPEQFKELYTVIKESDPEMFQYFFEVADTLGKYCLNLTTEK